MPDIKTSVPTETLERRRSAMVMYDLERALGALLATAAASPKELPSKLVSNIVARERERRRVLNELDVSEIIRATYLQEILEMLRHVFADRVQNEHILRLDELFALLRVADIRNAISHPNRPFPPTYWRRLAAIASDDAVHGLGLSSVVDTLAAAESGQLEDPPAQWLARHRWEFPNNIPASVEHQITGLIGRKKEMAELQRLLSTPRINLVAIVGPGGVGKTALLLEVLSDMVSRPDILHWTDRVLYLTAKTERLTIDGIEAISSTEATLVDIQNRVYPLMTGGRQSAEEPNPERLLLCIDNLETLLRDDPTVFDEFYRSLPPHWRVVVTSRVSVNSATVMPLKPLNQQGAEQFGRMYAIRRGADLQESTLTKLAVDCDRNPLAIRLCIDAYVAGRPLPDATTSARGRVIEFSYKNLVAALLPVAKKMLECLFVAPEPLDRETACILLGCTTDDAAEAFIQLCGTALLIRKPGADRETYELSPLVREFLLMEPIDLTIREQVQREMRRVRTREASLGSQAASTEASPASIRYLPVGAKGYVATLVNSVVDCLDSQSRKSQSEVLAQVERALDSDPHNVVLARLSGVLLRELGDFVKAKQRLALAVRGDDFDLCAALHLTAMYRTDQELDMARKLAARIRASGAFEVTKVGKHCAEHALREFWVTEIWSGNIEGALSATSDWNVAGDLQTELGSIRAQARRAELAQCIENGSIGYENALLAEATLREGLDIWRELFSRQGYVGRFVDASWKLVLSACSAITKGIVRSPKAAANFSSFIDEHLVGMCSVHHDLQLGTPEVGYVLRTAGEMECEGKNPLTSERWIEYYGGFSSSSLGKRKRVMTGIVTQRFERKDYMHITGEDGLKYYVRREKVEQGTHLWNRIRVGDQVFIEPNRTGPESGNLPTVRRLAWMPPRVTAKRG